MMEASAAGGLLAGRFELQATLGRGGMATVYRAWDHDRKRPCAVKVLSEVLSGDEQFRRRFRQEAAAAQSLTHPNIVRVDDWGEAGSHHYIVMEYVEGGTLRDLMRRCGPLPQPAALRIAVDVAAALAHAHNQGLVHRDIKPENLLLAEDGRIKVADFGIARTVDAAALTRTGIVMGSARYLSPEQARGHAAGPRSDLYALGVVLFEMLAGRVPFDGDSAVAIAVQHVHEQPPRLQQLRPDIAAPIAACVERLLAKREDDRYSTAEALAEDLRRCGALLPSAVEDGGSLTESLVRARGTTTETAHLDLAGEGPLAISRTALLAPDGVTAAAGATAALPAPNTTRIGGALPAHLPQQRVPSAPPQSGAPGAGRRSGNFRSAALAVLMLVLATMLGSHAYWPGRRLVALPSLVGQSVSAASSTVGTLGLRLVVAARRQDARMPVGLIVAQDPPPGLVGNGLEVRVVVSQGSGIVPDLHGLSLGEATRLVQMAGLRLQLVGDVGRLTGGEDQAHAVVFQFQPAGMRLGPDAIVYVLLGAQVDKHPDPVPGWAPPRQKDGGQER